MRRVWARVSSYQAIGNLVGVLGIVWGIFAAISGRLSDAIGHRKILIPAIFSVLPDVGVLRYGRGLASLIAIRGLMGIMEGSYCPTSFHRDSGRGASFASRLPSGIATERIRAFWIWTRPDHRDSASYVRVLAAGFLGCCNSRHSSLVCCCSLFCASRKTRREEPLSVPFPRPRRWWLS